MPYDLRPRAQPQHPNLTKKKVGENEKRSGKALTSRGKTISKVAPKTNAEHMANAVDASELIFMVNDSRSKWEFDVQERIETLKARLDPAHPKHPAQAVREGTIAAAIAAYENGFDGRTIKHFNHGQEIDLQDFPRDGSAIWTEFKQYYAGAVVGQAVEHDVHARVLVEELDLGMAPLCLPLVFDTGAAVMAIRHQDLQALGANLATFLPTLHGTTLIMADGSVNRLPTVHVWMALCDANGLNLSEWFNESAVIVEDNSDRLTGPQLRRTFFFGSNPHSGVLSVAKCKYGLISQLKR